MEGDLLTVVEPKKRKLTASDIHRGMASKWMAPEWAILWEVGEGTGTNAGRYADAVMMSLWPSRGLELHGVEVKVSRSDWKREAADPRKAEAIAKYCDRWWIHTPPGIVADLSELPPAWGLREFDGKAWKTIREAEKTDAAQITRSFLAALLRRGDELHRRHVHDAVENAREVEIEREKKRNESWRQEVDAAADRKLKGLTNAQEKLDKFEAAFGKGVLDNWGIDPERLGKVALVIERLGILNAHSGIADMAEKLRKQADGLNEALAILAPPVSELDSSGASNSQSSSTP